MPENAVEDHKHRHDNSRIRRIALGGPPMDEILTAIHGLIKFVEGRAIVAEEQPFVITSDLVRFFSDHLSDCIGGIASGQTLNSGHIESRVEANVFVKCLILCTSNCAQQQRVIRSDILAFNRKRHMMIPCDPICPNIELPNFAVTGSSYVPE
ncbi:MAG TPA: hypothetical protein VF845_13510 [Terriglobales bacterium]